jgi:hypothetical protein
MVIWVFFVHCPKFLEKLIAEQTVAACVLFSSEASRKQTQFHRICGPVASNSSIANKQTNRKVSIFFLGWRLEQFIIADRE